MNCNSIGLEECPEGTHAYTTNCRPMTPEATCDEPNPVMGKYDVCDYSSCYCDHPTVRDTASNMCVKQEECPKKSY
ncbi:putative protease inhibitor 4 [Operophtera brumata]|uniref:Putative protease inhibitor 4 n=1 Tax=Operophtera brumata TaxID=104452 RepID=A0A0L7LRM1_OPEBR|nr:putative protease inhibitor 4 [Operophtera brumata]